MFIHSPLKYPESFFHINHCEIIVLFKVLCKNVQEVLISDLYQETFVCKRTRKNLINYIEINRPKKNILYEK